MKAAALASTHVLVLAPSFAPLGRCSWQRSIALWFTGKVEILEEYDEEVHSVSRSMQVPAVIRYLKGPLYSRRRIRMSRENIYLRDQGCCLYCGRHISRAQATFDHVVPRAQGGISSWQNLATACSTCNRQKSARTPEQANMKLRSKPERPTQIAEVWTVTMDAHELPKQWTQYLKDWAYWHTKLDP